MKSHLTMSELEELGFEIIKSYVHDGYTTQRRVKGCITVETTYNLDSGKFESQNFKIDDSEWRTIRPEYVEILDKIVNKKP